MQVDVICYILQTGRGLDVFCTIHNLLTRVFVHNSEHVIMV